MSIVSFNFVKLLVDSDSRKPLRWQQLILKYALKNKVPWIRVNYFGFKLGKYFCSDGVGFEPGTLTQEQFELGNGLTLGTINAWSLPQWPSSRLGGSRWSSKCRGSSCVWQPFYTTGGSPPTSTTHLAKTKSFLVSWKLPSKVRSSSLALPQHCCSPLVKLECQCRVIVLEQLAFVLRSLLLPAWDGYC